MGSIPLVSVGLPTRNRATTLKRAVASVLTQDYLNLELVISDNASADETQALCREFCRLDGRVRYIRQQTNIGPTANFVAVLGEARGAFFMWLSDDDWLGTGFLSRCVEWLVRNPDYSTACGVTRLMQAGEMVREVDRMSLRQDEPTHRMLSLLWQVSMNSTFYGVTRRAEIARVSLHNVMGSDLYTSACMAFLGKVATLEGTYFYSTLGGMSSDARVHAAECGFSKRRMLIPFLPLAVTAFKDVMWVSPIYRCLSRRHRCWLACRAFGVIYWRYCMRWWHRFCATVRIRTRVRQAYRSARNRLTPWQLRG